MQRTSFAMEAGSLLIPLCALFMISAEGAPMFTKKPTKKSVAVEGANVTLEWRYAVSGGESFIRAEFEKGRRPIVLKNDAVSAPRIISSYRSRLHANITSYHASVTLFGVNRLDKGSYTLVVNFDPDYQTIASTVEISAIYIKVSIAKRFTSWVKDGFSINNNTRISISKNNERLTITNVSRTDSGEYQCVAKNRVGHYTSNSKVDVYFQPEVSNNGNQKQYVAKGGDIRLICRYEASPPVSEVHWVKDGTVIARNASKLINGSRVTIPSFNESQIQLSITAASLEDGGNYTCIVTNVLSSTQDTTMIIIEDPAKIVSHPQAFVTEEEGNNLTLFCNATGNPAAKILWTKDGTLIDNNSRINFSEDNKRLNIRNVNRKDKGSYRCVAKNSLGNDTSNLSTVDIQYRPEIASQPQIVWKPEEENVTLTCNATGNPEPELSWLKDEHLVTSSDRISLSPGNKSLMIANVNRTDSGKYLCVAHNKIGNATSSITVLDVQCLKLSKMWSKETPSSPTFSQTSSGEGITAKITLPRFPGNASFFQVIVIRYSLDYTGVVNSPDSFTPKDLMTYEEAHKSSAPAAYVTFQFRAHDFDAFREFVVGDGAYSNSETRKRRSSNEDDFHNKPLQPNTKYKVFLRAFIDKTVYISSNFVTIETKDKPNVKGLPERTIFRVGDVVVLTCEATGDPKPSVSWSKDGNTNIPRAQFRNDNHILVIQEVAPTDGGIYECRASNAFGQRRTATAVVIAVPPSIREDVSPPLVTCAKDTPCSLLCHATGDIPFNYSWTRNGQALDGRNIKVIKNTVIVTPLDDQDFGDYVCHATNSFGSTTYKITLSESQEEGNNVRSIFRAGDIAWSCIVFVLLVLIGVLIWWLRRAQANSRRATAEEAIVLDTVQSVVPLEKHVSEPGSYMELRPRPSDGQTRVPSEYQSLQEGHANAGYYNVVPKTANKKGPNEEIYEEI